MRALKNSVPKVTVLMPVYNGERFLRPAIESILNQTFTDFELLIINDGSTDSSDAIIRSYSDPRIVYRVNERNVNLAQTLNKGTELARGKYIARMDSDDISLPRRLEKQVWFLDTHPEIALLGTGCAQINEANRRLRYFRMPSHPLVIRWKIIFLNCFIHSSVMFRKQALEKRRLSYGVVPDCLNMPGFQTWGIGDEDYLLFGALSLLEAADNLPEALLLYRIQSQSLTRKFGPKQREQENRIQVALASKVLGRSLSPLEAALFSKIANLQPADAPQLELLSELYVRFLHQHSVPEEIEQITNIDYVLREALVGQNSGYFFQRLLKVLLWCKRNPLNEPEKTRLLLNFLFGRKFAHWGLSLSRLRQ